MAALLYIHTYMPIHTNIYIQTYIQVRTGVWTSDGCPHSVQVSWDIAITVSGCQGKVWAMLGFPKVVWTSFAKCPGLEQCSEGILVSKESSGVCTLSVSCPCAWSVSGQCPECKL